MKHSPFHFTLRGLLAVFLALLAFTAAGAGLEHFKVVHGVAIYLGVLSSQMIQGHPEKEMHGGSPKGKKRYHVVISLFDDATRKRITGAQVKATVAEIGFGGERKTLEPMHIAGTETYGNWFTLADSGRYRIHLEISGIKNRERIEADFDYEQL
jgi:hypothetical protein